MQDSNRHPIVKFMSDFYVTDICTSNLWSFITFSNRHPMMKNWHMP